METVIILDKIRPKDSQVLLILPGTLPKDNILDFTKTVRLKVKFFCKDLQTFLTDKGPLKSKKRVNKRIFLLK